jgi:hypothetical protein
MATYSNRAARRIVIPTVCAHTRFKEGDELLVAVENDNIVLSRKATHFSAYLETLGKKSPKP